MDKDQLDSGDNSVFDLSFSSTRWVADGLQMGCRWVADGLSARRLNKNIEFKK